MRAACGKYLRLNAEMKGYLDVLRGKVIPKSAKRVLGVVARGTDYRYAGFDLPKPMDDEDYIALVQEKMEQWDCDYLLVATEDATILKRFEQAGFGDRLLFVEQERYEYTEKEKAGILVADLKSKKHNYRDEMPYLSVLYLLSECCALISNCRCGAYEVADFMNGNRYEYRYCCGEEA